jgi:hypothetical protein
LILITSFISTSSICCLKFLKIQLFISLNLSLNFLIQHMDWFTSYIPILSLPILYIRITNVLIYSWSRWLFYTKIPWILWLQWMLWVMDQLTFNRYVFIFDIFMLNRHILNIFFWHDLRDIASDMFNSIVVSGDNLSWDNINSNKIPIIHNFFFSRHECIFSFINVINNFFLHWDIFNSTISFNKITFNSWLGFNWTLRFSLNNNWTTLSNCWVWMLVARGIGVNWLWFGLVIDLSVIIGWIG